MITNVKASSEVEDCDVCVCVCVCVYALYEEFDKSLLIKQIIVLSKLIIIKRMN